MSTIKKTKEQLLHEQDLIRIRNLRLIDDDFMTACFDNNIEATELLLQIILSKQDLKVESVQTQETMKNLYGRSCRLDIHAIDSEQKQYDIEIQRADKGAGAKRARHNSSILDAHILKPGEEPESLPDSYVIFITENDVMNKGQAIYLIERYVTIGEKKQLFGDGSHIVYVNASYRDEKPIGKLMHDFFCTDPADMNYKILADRVNHFKKEEEGVIAMCKTLEEMREEAAKKRSIEVAEQMIADGQLSLEKIASYSKLPLEEVEKLAEVVPV